MEKFIQNLIYFHAALGGIALLAGTIALIAKKGSMLHKKTGLVFYYAMIFSATTAMFIAVLPQHISPFLFSIGIFSLYFVLTGKRALRLKKRNSTLFWDKIIAAIMLITGFLMVLLPILLTQKIQVILTVFGLVGIVFSIRDFKAYKNPKELRKKWLQLHIGKMMGGYISATTAFVVVNNVFPGISGWFIPGFLGSIIIYYWIKKINKKTR
jgi:uncharacterized membrane protein